MYLLHLLSLSNCNFVLCLRDDILSIELYANIPFHYKGIINYIHKMQQILQNKVMTKHIPNLHGFVYNEK